MVRRLLIVFVAAIGVAIISAVAYAAIHGDGARRGPQARSGALATRQIAWAGADSLDISTMADVTYVQGATPKITVTGKAAALDHIKVDGGKIRMDVPCGFAGSHFSLLDFKIDVGNDEVDDDKDAGRDGCIDIGGLKIEVVGPSTTRFEISGGGRLKIENYDQPRLDLALGGLGAIEVAGRTDQLDLDLSGGGEADLSDLEVKEADVDISGLGTARMKPSQKAKINISGGGKVDLLSHPANLESQITGLGKINQP